jgi:hypothetical protein
MASYDKIEIRPTTGPALEINTNDIPVFNLETDPEYSNPSQVEKSMLSGLWPTFNLARGMPLTMEGAIFGRGANDVAIATDMATRTQTFKTALHRVSDLTPPTARVHGVLRLRQTGWGEDADAPYHVVSVRVPDVAGQVAVSEWFVSLFMFNIWFEGVNTTTKFFV